MILLRSEIMRSIRDFFHSRGYPEIDTPLLSPRIIPESTIELFSTRYLTPYGESRDLYLLPSPEYWHKKLLASFTGTGFYQMAKVFRNSEQTGLIHNIEFTMLEWYSKDRDYRFSLGMTKELLQHLANTFMGEMLSFRTMSVRDACMRYANLDPAGVLSHEAIREVAEQRGHILPDNESWNDTFSRIFVSEVEPRLETDTPLFLTDYPAGIPCLARETPDGAFRERWELYWKGMEIANCYTEETDAEKVRQFFEKEGIEKDRRTLEKTEWDHDYWRTFTPEYPQSSGVAAGVDRLIMALTGKKDIAELVFFPFLHDR